MLEIKGKSELQKNLMFSMVKEMIISEYWTVSYCRYLVEQFEKIYPKESSRINHLKSDLKVLDDKNGEEEREINNLLFRDK